MHRAAAVQYNAYGKFQCASGDDGSIPRRAAPLGAATHRAVGCGVPDPV